jgi:hypothetical protein
MEGLFISFLYLLLHIAIILLIAYAIVWVCNLFGLAIDGNVYKMGKIVVMLLCIIAVVVWLFGALGGLGAWTPTFR